MALSNTFAGRAANALQTMIDSAAVGADLLSNNGKDKYKRGEGVVYPFEGTLNLLTHHIFDREDAPSSPRFSTFLSWVMTEVRDY